MTIALDRNSRTNLTAPASSIVQQLQVHAIGAVVRPADPLLVIVPEGTIFVVEAQVLNRDAGFVREGQAVRVKLLLGDTHARATVKQNTKSLRMCVCHQATDLCFQLELNCRNSRLTWAGATCRSARGWR